MKKVVLLCASGMSTSMLMNKMKEASEAKGLHYDIAAYGLASAPQTIPSADIVLLGPQVRYNQAKLKQEFPGKIIECIDMVHYGMMNGDAVIEFAKDKMEE